MGSCLSRSNTVIRLFSSHERNALKDGPSEIHPVGSQITNRWEILVQRQAYQHN